VPVRKAGPHEVGGGDGTRASQDQCADSQGDRTEIESRVMTAKPTTYFQMQQEHEQQLAADATADGHDALRLQASKKGAPVIPQQPANSPWACDPVPSEAPLGYSVDEVRGSDDKVGD
jgi:hypothetical protein